MLSNKKMNNDRKFNTISRMSKFAAKEKEKDVFESKMEEYKNTKRTFKKDTKENRTENKEWLKKLQKREKAKSTTPNSVFDTIPYIADLENGVFEISKNRYSKTFKFSDVNYQVSSESAKEVIFENWASMINIIDDDYDFSYTIYNHYVPEQNMLQDIILSDDAYENECDKELIEDWNNVMKNGFKMGLNDIQKDRYFTIAKDFNSYKEAVQGLSMLESECMDILKNFGCTSSDMSTEEILEFLHDLFRPEEIGEFKVDWKWLYQQGLSSKDIICPSSFDFSTYNKDGSKNPFGWYFKIDEKFYCCLQIQDLPQDLYDDLLSKMTDFHFPIMLTVTGRVMPAHKAIKYVENNYKGIKKDIQNKQKSAVHEGYDPELSISDELQERFYETKAVLDVLRTAGESLIGIKINVMIEADTLKELTERYNLLKVKARKCNCKIKKMYCMQEDVFKEVLPLGHNIINNRRTVLTEDVGVLIPFVSQEIFQKNGTFISLNAKTRNMILVDRYVLPNGNGWIFGETGKGKSFITDRLFTGEHLKYPDLQTFIIDPDGEHVDEVEALGGQVIKFSANTQTYYNICEINENYGVGDNLLAEKTLTLLSFCDCALKGLRREEIGWINRGVRKIYEKYLISPSKENIPTFTDLWKFLTEQKDQIAKNLALSLETYAEGGAMSIFSHRTNININNRLVCFDISDLKGQLRNIGINVMQELIWTFLRENRADFNARVSVIIDEIQVLFEDAQSEELAEQLYARIRKYNGRILGVTQNPDKLLASEKARGMMSNSSFAIMLSQSEVNRKVLEKMYGLSPEQLSFVKEAKIGQGLIKVENAIIPFYDRFPKDTILYKFLTTNPSEVKLYKDFRNEFINKRKRGNMLIEDEAIQDILN